MTRINYQNYITAEKAENQRQLHSVVGKTQKGLQLVFLALNTLALKLNIGLNCGAISSRTILNLQC